MVNLSYAPAPPLGEFVDSLWLFADSPPHARERIVPSGTLELVINLREDEIRIYDSATADRYRRFPGAVVSGAYRHSFVIDTREHASIIGVHFKPGGASPFLGIPAEELTDAHVDLEALWGPCAKELHERLCDAGSPARRFRLLEDALIARLSRPPQHRDAVRCALACLAQGDMSVAKIVERIGLSHRHFIHLFCAEVGLTPKLFARVHRFQRALSLTQRTSPPAWAQVALECGYYDQAHLIRDFVALSSFTPMDYLRHRSDRVKVNHLALS